MGDRGDFLRLVKVSKSLSVRVERSRDTERNGSRLRSNRTAGQITASLLLALLPFPALATDPAAGLYRAAEGPELASHLQLSADGRFRYELAYGALDEQAEGRWQRAKDAILLFTEPRPKPPEFRADAMTTAGDAPLSLTVSWPNGNGIAGVDFKIGFDSGDPVEGYTQYYGWTLDPSDKRRPSWIELSEPMHRIGPKRFPIPDPDTRTLRFTLMPNDLGIADFEGTRVTVEGDHLVLHHKNGPLRYVRVKMKGE
jgi:hypothetical protein